MDSIITIVVIALIISLIIVAILCYHLSIKFQQENNAIQQTAQQVNNEIETLKIQMDQLQNEIDILNKTQHSIHIPYYVLEPDSE